MHTSQKNRDGSGGEHQTTYAGPDERYKTPELLDEVCDPKWMASLASASTWTRITREYDENGAAAASGARTCPEEQHIDPGFGCLIVAQAVLAGIIALIAYSLTTLR